MRARTLEVAYSLTATLGSCSAAKRMRRQVPGRGPRCGDGEFCVAPEGEGRVAAGRALGPHRLGRVGRAGAGLAGHLRRRACALDAAQGLGQAGTFAQVGLELEAGESPAAVMCPQGCLHREDGDGGSDDGDKARRGGTGGGEGGLQRVHCRPALPRRPLHPRLPPLLGSRQVGERVVLTSAVRRRAAVHVGDGDGDVAARVGAVE